jgi:hypothetical protein
MRGRVAIHPISRVGEYFLDGAFCQRHKFRVRLGVVGDDHGSLMEREAACPVPRAGVDVEGVAKRSPSGAAEHGPGGDHVGRRIARPGTAEVYDRVDSATMNKDVGPQQVCVYPHRRSPPRRRLKRLLPGNGGRIAVYDVPGRLDRRAREGVELAERLAPAAWCPDGVYPAQLGHEPREIPGSLVFIVD